MPLFPARRICRIALALLLAAACSGPAVAAGMPVPPPGQLLIASRSMGDPRFDHAVVLILHHDAGGAFGVVINRPIGERSIKSLLAATGDDKDNSNVAGNLRVFVGGPVEPQLGFVIHTPDYRGNGTLAIDDMVAMTASRAILVAIGHHRGPRKSFIAFGYAGWAAGQLEAEIADHAWYTAPADPQLIFDAPRDEVWDDAMARRLREL
jgi:putative transcriptional regulator